KEAEAGVGGEANGGSGAEPVMMVLSAKDPERLQERAQQLREAIAREGWGDGDLRAMAYTLQVGREAMEHRLALTVESMKELAEKLERYGAGEEEIEGLYRGEVKRNKETLAVFAADDELQEAIGKWIQNGKYSKLLDLWVKGLVLDWERLYGESRPRKMS